MIYENEKLEARYAPGPRFNSFFEDMPIKEKKRKKRKLTSVKEEEITGFSYYIDQNGKLVQDVLK